MGLKPDLIPDRAPMVLARTDLIAPEWQRWLQKIADLVASSAQMIGNQITQTFTGATGPSPVPLPSLDADTYRVTVYVRVTVPAATSSSITVVIGWTQAGLALTWTSPALTGNTTTSVMSASVPVMIDPKTSITYQTLVSVTPTVSSVTYLLGITVERL